MALRNLVVELPNGSAGDSLVLVRRPLEGRTLVFDAGDARRIARVDLLRLDHIFVSHCHIDHFIGFDALIRPRVCLPQKVTAHGPPGFLDRVAGRLAGYTWNLTDGNHFVLEAREMRGEVVASATFDSGQGFRRVDGAIESHGVAAWEGDGIEVRCVALDHRIVSMGWSVSTPTRYNVRDDAVRGRGLTAGPWLGRLKALASDPSTDRSQPLELPDGSAPQVAELIATILVQSPGERVTYVTDTLYTEQTRRDIVELARGADMFVCEAPFLHSELDKATRSHHLTARQAGSLAAEAGVGSMLLFHVSDRYQGRFADHVAEATAASGGIAVEARSAFPSVV